MKKSNKFKFPKKFVAFFTIVPLLTATAIIQVPCPVCDGKGYVSSTGMDGVQVADIKALEYNRFLVGCDSYRIYQYEITLKLENHGDRDAAGYVSFILVSSISGQLLDTQYGVAEVPQNTSVELQYTTYFQIAVTVDMPKSTSVNVKLLEGNVSDKACSGTGKVALNSWPLINSMIDGFIETQRIAKPFQPPLWVETEGQAGLDYHVYS
jgi:hypothetical protein